MCNAYYISDEVKEEHARGFEECVSVYVYEGMSERCGSKLINPDCYAYHGTLTEVGCLEFSVEADGEFWNNVVTDACRWV